MAYILDGTTLRNPQELEIEELETGVAHETIDGKLKKSVTNRRRRFVLRYQNLTRTQENTILNIWNQQDTVTFESTETNLTVASTTVHVEVFRRAFNRGSEYRSDLSLILTESE